MNQLFKFHLPALAWATVILFLTLLPAKAMPQVPAWELISFATASHAVVFFILAVLLRFDFSQQSAWLNLRRNNGWFTLVLSVLFGILIEVLQTLMKLGRQGDPMDVVSNTIGTVLGIVFFSFVYPRLFPGTSRL